MTTLIKFIIGVLTSLLVTSCVFNGDFGQVRGNGNVQTENFNITQDFDGVTAGNGWDVYLEKGSEVSVIVEADENLIELADIYVKGSTLKIYSENNISSATSKKVFVTYVGNLQSISANSGADIVTKEVLKGEDLSLNVSSGGSIKAEAIVRNIDTDVSSGGSIRLAGSSEKLDADVSSGGVINAKELRAKYANASASSGGNIDIRVTDKLRARASSGGDIDYWGNPKEVDKPKKNYSGGSVDAKE
ncbi:head GIN domain-containing protein [uncultured Dokdonia sp.]|uniref:head GIN domain-containing protein n=1 Tax=uncultured Dokdonia sp. TaxID=575653 RepID=UPI00262F2B86|nr:head GIN domain-containing protein [uncultured Dokdonia sp.]